MVIHELTSRIAELSEENTFLRAENELLKSIKTDQIITNASIDKLYVNKYRKALEEIRECAKTEIAEIMTRADYKGFLALKGIIAKINEVIGEK